jgi:site-specific DNA-adenine methylase
MFPYIGGKSNHVKWLDPLFPNNGIKTYVEVFGGAGWVGIKSEKILTATTRVYNDFNPFIANIHECFRSKQTELLKQLNGYPKSDRQLYQQFQQEIFGPNPPKVVLGDVELAAKYLYMQTQIFSGVTLNATSPIYFCDVASNGKYASKYEAVKNKLNNKKFTDRLSGVTKVENKRYTMRDIGKLEKRIDNLEYYTSLSLLEQQTESLNIIDADVCRIRERIFLRKNSTNKYRYHFLNV